MWGITLLDFAAGKGHMRVMRYVLEHGEKHLVNKPSFRERINAVDRACKVSAAPAQSCSGHRLSLRSPTGPLAAQPAQTCSARRPGPHSSPRRNPTVGCLVHTTVGLC